MSLYVSNILVLAHQPHLLCLFLLLLRSLLDDCDHLGFHLIDDFLLCLQTFPRSLDTVIDEIKLLECEIAILAFSFLLFLPSLTPLLLCC